MKTLKPDIFYREQILANLRFIYEKEVDVLTCRTSYGIIVAFAYAIRGNGRRIKIMQASSTSDTITVLCKLHNMSSKYLQNYLAGCNHEVLREDLEACEVILPSQSSDAYGDPRSPELKQSRLQSNDVVSLGNISFAGNIPETVETEEDHENPRAETYKTNMLPESNNTGTGTGILLGILYNNQGKLKQAEEMCQRALVGHEKALGPDHISTLTSVNNLGMIYAAQRKLKQAEMYQRALVGHEKALCPDHISTLTSVNNLGNLYRDQGKLKQAEEMYQRALVGCEKALDPDHHITQQILEALNALKPPSK